jgi:hypothetical protein
MSDVTFGLHSVGLIWRQVWLIYGYTFYEKNNVDDYLITDKWKCCI